MARTGAFDELDGALTWHPSFVNSVWGAAFLANNSVRFHFKGIPSHAAAAPEAGRSALDAVELMDIGANYLREHVPSDVRIHYVITNGGRIPNTVPEDAEVWYNVRCPKRADLKNVMGRLLRIAQGAALMTDTRMTWHLEAGCYEVLANRTLGDALYRNMAALGGPAFDEDDRSFAEKLYEQVPASARENVINNFRAPEGCRDQILSDTVFKNRDDGYAMPGSTDVGDVSQIVPLATMTAACWPVGVSSHTWMSCACTGSGIGSHAMMFAAKALALTGLDLLTQPELLFKAKEEFRGNTKGMVYCSAFDEEYGDEN